MLRRGRAWLVTALALLLIAYVTGPFVDGGIYLTRPYVRLVSWSNGLEGFGVCHDNEARNGGFVVRDGRSCD